MRAVGDDAERPGAQGPGFRKTLQRLCLAVEEPAGDLQQALALRCQRDTLLQATEEKDVVFLLEFAHLVRDRRLGEVQFFRRAGKAAVEGDVVKGAKLDVAHGMPPVNLSAPICGRNL